MPPMETPMETVGRPLPGIVHRTRQRVAVSGVAVSISTALVILAASLLILVQPAYLHPALDAAGSASLLGVAPTEAHRLSDATVAELVAGPGSFDVRTSDGAAVYSPAEVGHLRNVRLVLYAFLAVAGLCLAFLLLRIIRSGSRAGTWAAIRRGAMGLGVGLVVAGVVAFVAFEPAFELFHRVFFPGGNWAFDPTTDRLVQLYPLAFWQLTTMALGLLSIGLALIVWLLTRRRTPSDPGARVRP